MWMALYDELTHYDELRGLVSTDSATVGQIYAFALHCFKIKKPKFLCADVWIFFDHVVGGYIVGSGHLRRDLPALLSVKDFEYWAQAFKGNFSPEKYGEAMKQFRSSAHAVR